MSEAPELNDDFKDVLAELIEAGADFLVVGAHALAAHGIPRATGDLDVLVRPTAENAELVWRALLRFGAPLQAHGLKPVDFAKPEVVYQMGLPPRRIDLLTSISGVSFETAWSHRVERAVAGLRLAFISRADLLANKRAAARPKDLLDVELLEEADRK